MPVVLAWDKKDLTLEDCAALARAAGLRLYGVQFSWFCFGGNDLSLATSLGHSEECTRPCGGNSSQVGRIRNLKPIRCTSMHLAVHGIWTDSSYRLIDGTYSHTHTHTYTIRHTLSHRSVGVRTPTVYILFMVSPGLASPARLLQVSVAIHTGRISMAAGRAHTRTCSKRRT